MHHVVARTDDHRVTFVASVYGRQGVAVELEDSKGVVPPKSFSAPTPLCRSPRTESIPCCPRAPRACC